MKLIEFFELSSSVVLDRNVIIVVIITAEAGAQCRIVVIIAIKSIGISCFAAISQCSETGAHIIYSVVIDFRHFPRGEFDSGQRENFQFLSCGVLSSNSD